jgi:hypothetical protein
VPVHVTWFCIARDALLTCRYLGDSGAIPGTPPNLGSSVMSYSRVNPLTIAPYHASGTTAFGSPETPTPSGPVASTR